jgi:hypothetical protein
MKRISNNCFVNNFKGAAVGLFSASLIVRKLGLADNTHNTNTTNISILNIDPLDDTSNNGT